MSFHEPPSNQPPVALADSDGLRRLQFRLWQIGICALTILATAWFFSQSTVAGIICLFITKHILVALLMMGLDRHPPRKE